MADQFIGEIRPFAFGLEPRGWAVCDGRLLSVSDHTTLFSVIGTKFGGDGVRNFALPDLRGRAPIGEGRGPGLTERALGSTGGAAEVALSESQIPVHNHPIVVTPLPANSGPAESAIPGRASSAAYADASLSADMSPGAITSSGGGQPHQNRQPYLVISFYIALQGEFPS